MVALLKNGVDDLKREKAASCGRQELVASRVRDLQAQVQEQEKVRDLISQESVERAACIERLMQSLGNTN
jgi:hypothetical protein